MNLKQKVCVSSVFQDIFDLNKKQKQQQKSTLETLIDLRCSVVFCSVKKIKKIVMNKLKRGSRFL